MAIAASKAGTPELQCKTYEELKRLLETAAESVGGTICTLPKVPGFFSIVPKRVKGDFVANPAYDEEMFKALPKQEQTSKRQRTMKYLQGPCASKHRHKGHAGHNKITPAYSPQANDSASGPQADCMLASSCGPGRLCPLCLCVSLRLFLWEVLWEVAHRGPHPNLGRAGLSKATWLSPFHQGNTAAACDDERYVAFLTFQHLAGPP